MFTDDLFEVIKQLQKLECCNKKLNDYPASDFLRFTINDKTKPKQYSLFDKCLSKEEKTTPYCYWFSNKGLLEFLSTGIDCKIESYIINQTINKNLVYLWHSHKQYYDYTMRWCYLVLVQLSKNFDKTIFSKCNNYQSILNTIQSMITELVENPVIADDDLFDSAIKGQTWIVPSGVLYNMSRIPIEVKGMEHLCLWIHNEIASIKANYRMCIIDELQHDEMFDMVL